MMDVLAPFSDPAIRHDLIATGALLGSVVVLYTILLQTVRKRAQKATVLRWRAQLRNVALLCLGFGLVVIWSHELRTAALSLVAFALAVVIATKELILCVMGSLLRASSGGFSVGDRISVGDVQGDVIDTGLFATKLLQTGPGHQRTGRVIVLPNAVFLSQAVTNERRSVSHVLHVVTVPVSRAADVRRAEEALLRAAQEVTGHHSVDSRRSLRSLQAAYELDESPDSIRTKLGEPRVLLRFVDENRVDLMVRVPTPPREKGEIEQAILRGYLQRLGAPGPQAAPREEASGLIDLPGQTG